MSLYEGVASTPDGERRLAAARLRRLVANLVHVAGGGLDPSHTKERSGLSRRAMRRIRQSPGSIAINELAAYAWAGGYEIDARLVRAGQPRADVLERREELERIKRDGDCDWSAFDSKAYHARNYREMRADDARILGIVRHWFRTAVPSGPRLRGIDVGTGSNLYPALAMLPYCADVTLYEHSTANVRWLKRELADVSESWAPFALAAGSEWRTARYGLERLCYPRQGSIFDLPRRRFEIGTAFFVAESMTADRDEFEQALGCFLGALKPDAPFAAAFMENSDGYRVGDTWFPAVPLTGPMLGAAFTNNGAADGFIVHHVDIDPAPIRAGYSGYLVATGRSAGVA